MCLVITARVFENWESTMTDSQWNKVKDAKATLKRLLADDPNVAGVGVTWGDDEDYRLLVNYTEHPGDRQPPAEVAGVAVVWKVVGEIYFQ